MYKATQKVAEFRGSSVEEEILEAIQACVAKYEKEGKGKQIIENKE